MVCENKTKILQNHLNTVQIFMAINKEQQKWTMGQNKINCSGFNSLICNAYVQCLRTGHCKSNGIPKESIIHVNHTTHRAQ